MPGLNWTYVSTNDPLNVDQGFRINLQLRGANENLLSDTSFIQAAVRSKWIYSFTETSRFILRGDVGTTVLENDFSAIPASIRFFTGGDRTVRGYSLDSIGPRDENDEVIGGKHLMVGSLEYDYRIRDQWSIAAFIDSGDAFDDEAPEFKTGVGVGVRWQSPVGPVRVDLASGLNEPGDTIRLHFNLGPDL